MIARILVVEDEQIIAADLCNKLTRMGYEVVGTAIAGEEAITIAEELKPDLVLMDVQLEGEMTGVEAGKRIQERTSAAIVFVTAFPSVFVRHPTQILHPGLCLGKPFSRMQLESVVKAALGTTSRVES